MRSLSEGSLARRTLIYIAALASASIVIIGGISLFLIAMADALLPDRARGGAQAPETPAGAAPSAPAPATDSGEGSPKPLRRCCAALKQNAKSAPPEHVAIYMLAAGVCNGLAPNAANGWQEMQGVFETMKEISVPSACRR
jgi:hypothetical protein